MTPKILPPYELCWHCRCLVPNGLVRRRTVNTGYSRGHSIGTGFSFTTTRHYREVSLCAVCDIEEAETARLALVQQGEKGAAVCRIFGVGIGLGILTALSVPFGLSLTAMLALAYVKRVGVALLVFYLVWITSDFYRLTPPQVLTHVVYPWAGIMAGVVGVKLIRKRYHEITTLDRA